MTWALVVVGGASLVGAGAAYAGANKQAKASEKAGNLNMDMFNTLNRQQQPFIQSGYGAMSKLNTLLGLSPRPMASMPSAPTGGTPSDIPQGNTPFGRMYAEMRARQLAQGGGPDNAYMPTPGGGVQPIMQNGPAPIRWNVPEANMPNLQLRQILSLRAQNGDRQAQAMLQRIA